MQEEYVVRKAAAAGFDLAARAVHVGGGARAGGREPARGSYVHTARDSQKVLGGTQLVIQAPHVGEFHVHNEADENRLLAKLDAWRAR